MAVDAERATPVRVRRDLGTAALVGAGAVGLLALVQPVATLTTAGGAGPSGTATSSWFGTERSTVGGLVTSTPGAAPAFGWAVLAGVVLVAVAAVLRLRTGAARSTTLGAGTWLLTTGVLVALHGHERAERERDVLARIVPGSVVLHPSASPWLLVAAGVLAALAALARPRAPFVRAHRAPEPGVVTWTPVPRP